MIDVVALPQHDIGVREVAAMSARLSYVFMCLTLSWGILTYTGWINDLIFRHRRDVDTILAGIQICAILAACNHQYFYMIECLIQTPACFFGYQPEFVIVTEQEVRAFHITR